MDQDQSKKEERKQQEAEAMREILERQQNRSRLIPSKNVTDHSHHSLKDKKIPA